MIISYEKHLNDYLNREQSLQKIIKTQEENIRSLQLKLNEKTEHLILPMKMRYESELSLKNRELLDIENKLKETQAFHTDEIQRMTSMLESHGSTNQTLQRQLEKEKAAFDQKAKELEVSLKSQIELLSEENEQLMQENQKMRQDIIEMCTGKNEMEVFVEEFNALQANYKERETGLLAEQMHLRTELEELRSGFTEQLSLSQKDRRLLQRKIDDMLSQVKANESDMKYEVEQFKDHLKELNREFAKKNAELNEAKSAKDKMISELMREKEDLEHQVNNQREELVVELRKKDEGFERKLELLSKEMLVINEQKSNELEKFIREIEVLRNEKLMYEKNLEEAKKLLASKESTMTSELVRQKIALDRLIELGQQRENLLQDDIKNLHESMINLQRAYENKENMLLDENGDRRKLIGLLERVSDTLKKYENAIIQCKNQENRKITELLRENKTNLSIISEKTKEIEKLRTELAEKKAREKNPIAQSLDRVTSHTQDLNEKLQTFSNILQALMECDADKETTNQKVAIIEVSPQRTCEVELLKYEQQIIKNEAELDLAKKSLLMYINHVKELEEQIEVFNSERGEKVFSNQELLDLRLESTKLKEENKYLFELNQKLEENIFHSLQKLCSDQTQEQLMEKKMSTKTLSVNSKVMNMSASPGIKKLSGNQKPQVEKTADLKRFCRQILDGIQTLQKNLFGLNSTEGEQIKSLQQTIKVYEGRIIQYEKVFENDLASINKKLALLEENIMDPYCLTQKTMEDLRAAAESLAMEMENFPSKNSFSQNVWREFESKLKRSPFLQDGEKNLLYQTEQQTITILRSETTSLYNMIEQEREKHKQELSNLVQNNESANQLLEEKLESMKIELDNEKSVNAKLRDLIENTRIASNKESKKLKFELNNLNKMVAEKQQKFNEERKKLAGEIQRLEQVMAQKEQNYKKMYETKLIRFVESIEERTKTINTKNVQTIQDEAMFRKIEEEKERKFQFQISALKDEITHLRESLKERESMCQKEKNAIFRINESLQSGMERMSGEKQKLLDQIADLNDLLRSKEALAKEREKQLSIELYSRKNLHVNH